MNNRAQEVGQIGLFHATDQLSLRKSGDNMLTAPPGAMQPLDQGDQVHVWCRARSKVRPFSR